MATRPARTRWAVWLSITRRGRWLAWARVSGDFERSLAAMAGKSVITPHIDAESRRGRDYIRVTLARTIAAPDVAEALSIAWQAFREAAAGDARGWDMKSTSAELHAASAGRPGPGRGA